MPIQTIYVKAASKKAINEDLAAGKVVRGVIYSFMSDNKDIDLAKAASDGDVIKIFDKFVSGSPYAKAYGNWDSKKGRVK